MLGYLVGLRGEILSSPSPGPLGLSALSSEDSSTRRTSCGPVDFEHMCVFRTGRNQLQHGRAGDFQDFVDASWRSGSGLRNAPEGRCPVQVISTGACGAGKTVFVISVASLRRDHHAHLARRFPEQSLKPLIASRSIDGDVMLGEPLPRVQDKVKGVRGTAIAMSFRRGSANESAKRVSVTLVREPILPPPSLGKRSLSVKPADLQLHV